MKIKIIISFCIIANVVFALEKESSSNEHHLNTELKNLIQQDHNDDFPELYDIEPLNEEELKKDYVRRHQYNRIIDELKKEEKISKFLDEDHLYQNK